MSTALHTHADWNMAGNSPTLATLMAGERVRTCRLSTSRTWPMPVPVPCPGSPHQGIPAVKLRLDNPQSPPHSMPPIDPPIFGRPAAPAEDAAPTAPVTATEVVLERRLAELLAAVVKKADVSVDANFFQDLGADSLVMARFCARVRKQPDLPAVSIKDIYQNPSISALAAA